MEGPALQPWHVGVEGLAREGVAERAPAQAVLSDQPPFDQLREAGGARDLPDELQVEGLAGDGGGLGGPAGLAGELGGADQDRVTDRVGHRHLATLRELEPAPSPRQRIGGEQRARKLLDEEGDALGAVVDRACERGRGGVLEDLGQELGGLGRLERRERQLVETPATAKIVPESPQRVVARQAVGTVGRDHEHGHLAERLRQRGQQLEGGVVGPLRGRRGRRSAARGPPPARGRTARPRIAVARSLARAGFPSSGRIRARWALQRSYALESVRLGRRYERSARRSGRRAPRRPGSRGPRESRARALTTSSGDASCRRPPHPRGGRVIPLPRAPARGRRRGGRARPDARRARSRSPWVGSLGSAGGLATAGGPSHQTVVATGSGRTTTVSATG